MVNTKIIKAAKELKIQAKSYTEIPDKLAILSKVFNRIW